MSSTIASSSVGASAPTGGALPPRKPGAMQKRDRRAGLLAVLPAFLVVVGFMAFPVGFAVFISFTRTGMECR